MSSARIEETERPPGRDPLAAKSNFQTPMQSMQPGVVAAAPNEALSGPDVVEKKHGAAPLAGSNERGTVRRSLTIEMSGSLTKLAAEGVKTTWSVAHNAAAVFQPERSDKGYSDVAGQCDITNAVMHAVSVTDIRSTGPTTR